VQWVNEVALPAGTLAAPSMRDIDFMEHLLSEIETRQIAAPSPIEQRWTCQSTSPMSLVSDPTSRTTLFSWVGIIMYLCVDDDAGRDAITQAFAAYRDMVATELDSPYSAYQHWAKIEVPSNGEAATALRARLAGRFPVGAFNDARRILDPKGVLANDFITHLFGDLL
jgi:L-galactono-1,4-lactone dehydrogenase